MSYLTSHHSSFDFQIRAPRALTPRFGRIARINLQATADRRPEVAMAECAATKRWSIRLTNDPAAAFQDRCGTLVAEWRVGDAEAEAEVAYYAGRYPGG